MTFITDEKHPKLQHNKDRARANRKAISLNYKMYQFKIRTWNNWKGQEGVPAGTLADSSYNICATPINLLEQLIN
jgi:hypothetical protein